MAGKLILQTSVFWGRDDIRSVKKDQKNATAEGSISIFICSTSFTEFLDPLLTM